MHCPIVTRFLLSQALGLRSSREPRLAMMASLDHSLHFYKYVQNLSSRNACAIHRYNIPHDLRIILSGSRADASEWLLFVMEAQAAGDGRGLVHGRIYTQDGKLAVVVQQEGVVRAQVPTKVSKL